MSKTDSPFAISALAAKVGTIGQARVVLGRAAELLQDGYSKLADIPNIAGLADESRRQLDLSNAYAMSIYKIYSGATPDLYDEEISFQNAARVGLALERARQTLVNIEDATNQEWWDIVGALQAALDSVATAVEWTVSKAANIVASAGTPLLAAFWPYLLGIAVMFIFVYRSELKGIFHE